MSDRDLQELRRRASEDPAILPALVRARTRAGELSETLVTIAALAGSRSAREARGSCPACGPDQLTGWPPAIDHDPSYVTACMSCGSMRPWPRRFPQHGQWVRSLVHEAGEHAWEVAVVAGLAICEKAIERWRCQWCEIREDTEASQREAEAEFENWAGQPAQLDRDGFLEDDEIWTDPGTHPWGRDEFDDEVDCTCAPVKTLVLDVRRWWDNPGARYRLERAFLGGAVGDTGLSCFYYLGEILWEIRCAGGAGGGRSHLTLLLQYLDEAARGVHARRALGVIDPAGGHVRREAAEHEDPDPWLTLDAEAVGLLRKHEVPALVGPAVSAWALR